ncbi:Galactose binding lectin domain-containing protein [Maridesulfovibrio ferrireducens]|uniref:Galactose binding lectin domain-containing protein n=1 Tax=Maridesulfovibrio ferrireducens TaxID=246191 RepID=A0A1G9J1F6_9BACT|nr:hypothetical protein [Maridesulfovibrio ferrireducens]SDL31195.1 Galactose binding lectin domain-containing protein [Maridesulfovibrio ferrireducens]
MICLVRKIFLLVFILSAVIYVPTLSAEMKITLKDGKVIEVPVSRENVKSIEYGDSVVSGAAGESGDKETQIVYGKNTIRIESAKYGNVSFELGNELGYKQYFCDAKDALIEKCDGKDRCKIIVGSQICGDPYPGKGKYLYVEYSCGEKLKRAKNTQTEIMLLKCP